MSGVRFRIVILLLFVIVFSFFISDNIVKAQEENKTHRLSIEGLETDDYYLGISYVTITSTEDDSIVYQGYVMNVSLIVSKCKSFESKEIGDGIRVERGSWVEMEKESNDTAKVFFYDFITGDHPRNISIPFNASYDIGKVVRNESYPAAWNLPEGEYSINAKGYTDEDKYKFKKFDKEYPEFIFNEKILLDEENNVILTFEEEYTLTTWEKSVLFMGENTNKFFGITILSHLIITALVVKKVINIDKMDSNLFENAKNNIKHHIQFGSPAIIQFTLMIFIYNYIEVFKIEYMAVLYYSYLFVFFIFMSALFFLKRNDISNPKKYRLFTHMMVIYGLGLIIILSFHLYLWFKSLGPACYAPMLEPWTPKISKYILLFPSLFYRINKKKLKEDLKEQGIYREEWDEI